MDAGVQHAEAGGAARVSGEDPARRDGGAVGIDLNLANSEGVNTYSRRDGDSDFKFLARDTALPCVDNRPMLVAGKPEIREYKAVFVGANPVGHLTYDGPKLIIYPPRKQRRT